MKRIRSLMAAALAATFVAAQAGEVKVGVTVSATGPAASLGIPEKNTFELMPKTLATATVDRLLHHAHVCQTSGDSVRLTQALAGQGVSPLN